MRRMLEKILRQYGTEMYVENQNGTHIVRAMLQPSYSKSWQNMEKAGNVLGVLPKSQFVYIGPAEPEIAEDWYLKMGSKKYAFRHVQTVYYENKPAYQWGLCVEVGFG